MSILVKRILSPILRTIRRASDSHYQCESASGVESASQRHEASARLEATIENLAHLSVQLSRGTRLPPNLLSDIEFQVSSQLEDDGIIRFLTDQITVTKSIEPLYFHASDNTCPKTRTNANRNQSNKPEAGADRWL